MRIGDLVSNDEVCVSPFTSVDAVEGKILERGYLVIKDQGKFIGILTADDVLSSGHNLVIDCCRKKPLVKADEEAERVMRRMLSEGLQVVPVVDEEAAYIGSVQTSQILRRILEITKRTDEIKWVNVVGDASFENTKNHFSSELFHNTRNQLQAILSAVDMLRAAPGAFETQLLLESIESNARMLDELITTIHSSNFDRG
jgi:predicted transcriptional regulator